MERHGPIESWIIDDTGFPKKGRHSVGVGRQYCGELGKQDNCQIAVTLWIANHHASLPAAYRLYLPKEWVMDRTRRRKAGVPKDVTFKTKPAIVLQQLRWASAAGLPRGVVLMDAGYGADTDLRTNITALGLSYVAGIMPQTSVWAPCMGSGCCGRTGRAAVDLQSCLGVMASTNRYRSRSLRLPCRQRLARYHVAGKPRQSRCPHALPACAFVQRIETTGWTSLNDRSWLLIEWPEGEEAPTKYWFSTLPGEHRVPSAR